MERFTLLTIAIFLFASITKAQITKGSIYLGGSIGASHVKQEVDNSTTEGKRSSILINPAVGIAVKDNLIVGIDFDYSNSSSKKFLNYGDYKTTDWATGIFIRKYVPLVKRLYFFGQSNLNYNHYKYEVPSTTSSYFSKTVQNTIEASFYPGLAFNVSKSFFIETTFPALVQIGYTRSTNTNNSYGSTVSTKEKGLFFSSQLSNSSYLNFGVRFIIPKK